MAADFFGDISDIVTKASTIVQSALYLDRSTDENEADISHDQLYYIVRGAIWGKQLKDNSQFICPWTISGVEGRCLMTKLTRSQFLENPTVIKKLGTFDKCSIPECNHGWKIFYEMISTKTTTKSNYPQSIWCELDDINTLISYNWVLGNCVKYLPIIINTVSLGDMDGIKEIVPEDRCTSNKKCDSKIEECGSSLETNTLDKSIPKPVIINTKYVTEEKGMTVDEDKKLNELVIDEEVLRELFNDFKYNGAALKPFGIVIEDIIANKSGILGPLYPSVSQQLKCELDKLNSKELIVEKKFYNKVLRLFHPDKYYNNSSKEEKLRAQLMYDIIEESFMLSKTSILDL